MSSNKKQDVVALLRRYESSVGENLAPHLGRCAELLQQVKRSQVTVSIQKERRQAFIPISELGGPVSKKVLVEQVEITVLSGPSVRTRNFILAVRRTNLKAGDHQCLEIDLCRRANCGGGPAGYQGHYH